MPRYVSGSQVSVTVIGQNFGLGSGEVPPLRLRPIPMPYALTPEEAEQCILAEDTLLTRATPCKEYRSLIGTEDGGVSSVCEHGDTSPEGIDTVLIKSESVERLDSVSYQPPYEGFPVFNGESAVFRFR